MGKNKYDKHSKVKKNVEQREIESEGDIAGTCAGCTCCSPTGSAKLCSNCRRGQAGHKKLGKPKNEII